VNTGWVLTRREPLAVMPQTLNGFDSYSHIKKSRDIYFK